MSSLRLHLSRPRFNPSLPRVADIGRSGRTGPAGVIGLHVNMQATTLTCKVVVHGVP